MTTKIIREEIYDENGLKEVIFHEVQVDNEQLIKEREDELIRIYEEIQALKNNSL